MTLLTMFRDQVAQAGDRTALICRDRRLTYAELADAAARTAALLIRAGVRASDRVVLIAPNLPEFGIGYLGILAAGATVVPLNPLLKADELTYVLEDSSARAVVCLDLSLPMLSAVRQDRPVPLVVLNAPFAGTVAGDASLVFPPPDPMQVADVEGAAEDVAVCLYTSGTTGRPKGALLTHGNLLANLQSFRQVLDVSRIDVFLAVLPLFHAYGGTVLFLMPLSLGASIVLEPRFSPDGVLQAIAQHRCTFFAGVPSMFGLMAAQPRPPFDFSAWRFCVSGGAPLPVSILEAFEARLGIPIYEGYGPTECAPVLTVNPPDGVRKVGSVGPPIPHVELRIVDDHDQPLPAGAVGEIVARGPNVMLGYLNRPAETAEALRGGWYHTGDLGRVDADGYCTIVERKKDLILVGALNVYPSEVELVLSSHPAVREAAIIGVPNTARGEVPKAFIILREGAEATPAELVRWCRGRLANYKVPRSVVIVPDLPRTATGKVHKPTLRAMS
ncbi:MAG TPA: long-chain fatty acid--CoA ligase [Candidatus Baltobacteraceae bacterium]|nr:long-chain fatty acid--CoA ligase [Candidatus Baltobacteraceae bacterium]